MKFFVNGKPAAVNPNGTISVIYEEDHPVDELLDALANLNRAKTRKYQTIGAKLTMVGAAQDRFEGAWMDYVEESSR